MANLIKSAKDEPDRDYTPPAGVPLAIKIDRANVYTDDGIHSFGLLAEITDGEAEGNKFWFNIRFTSDDDKAWLNAANLANSAALGVSGEALSKDDGDVLKSMFLKKEGVAVVTLNKNKKNPAKPFVNVVITAAAATVISSSTEEEDWD